MYYTIIITREPVQHLYKKHDQFLKHYLFNIYGQKLNQQCIINEKGNTYSSHLF